MKKYNEGGIYTAEMGKPPQDIDGASATKSPAPKKAPAPKKSAPKDSVFREGMPVPQDIDGGSASKPKRMASGGTASSRADGIASRGKTRGKMC
jgi:hypothetical protein